MPFREALAPANIATHPVTVLGVGCLALASVGTAGWVLTGGPEISTHEEAQVSQERIKGEVTSIDLDVQPITLLGFTTDIKDPDKATDALATVDQGTQVTLDRELAIKNDTFIKFNLNIPVSNPTLTWNGTVETRVLLDMQELDIQYDPGYEDDPSDDRFDVTLPLSAISTEAEVDPMGQEYDVAGDIRDWPANLVTAMTKSIPQLKKVPGMGQLAVANNKTEQFMAGVAQVGAMHDVQKACSPEVLQNQYVYQVVKEKIDTAFGSALRESAQDGTLDPELVAALQNMSGETVLNIPVTVYIGNENATNPNNLGQLKDFPAEYDDLIGELKDKASMEVGNSYTGDGLECELSQEVTDQLAHDSRLGQGETLRQRTEG